MIILYVALIFGIISTADVHREYEYTLDENYQIKSTKIVGYSKCIK